MSPKLIYKLDTIPIGPLLLNSRVMKKVLILTASFGEGHNTAARNIKQAIEISSKDVVVQVQDLFASAYGIVNKVVQKGHLQVAQKTPRLWGEIYNWLDHSSSIEGNLGTMTRLNNSLEDLLGKFEPDCVVSTYPAYAHSIREIYKDGAHRPFGFITVITDSISVNSVWFKAPSDYFCVPNEPTAEVLRKAGVAGSKIKTLGFPVSPAFVDESLPNVTIPAGSAPARVLYIPKSGKREARKTVGCLLEIAGLTLTIVAGKDLELKNRLLEQTQGERERVEVLGWTDQMPRLMRSHHLIISKAGGATVQESIAAKCPMIVDQIIPGQEEGNARLLEQLHIGAVAADPESIQATVKRALARNAKLWQEWRQNLQTISRPDAAFRIARLVLDSIDDTSVRVDQSTLQNPGSRKRA